MPITTVHYATTTRMAAITDYTGVVTGTLANNTARQANRAAIQAAVDDCSANNKILIVPPGRYEIHLAGLIIPGDFRLIGTMGSVIVQYSLDQPVVHVGPPLTTAGQTVENTTVDGLYLQYNGSATAGGNGLELVGAYMCSFKNLQIGDVQAPYSSRSSVPYMGVYCDETTGTIPCFSCSWDTVRIKHWGYRGFSAKRTAYDAATGNVWTNLYIAGGNSSGTQDTSALAGSAALALGSQAQAVFNQLNIEWVKLQKAVEMEICNQMIFNGVNLEGITLKASSSQPCSFFDLYGGSATIEGVTINNCTITTANNVATAAILRLGGPNSCARLNNIRPLLNVGVTAPFYGVVSNSSTSSRVDLGQFALGDTDALTAYDDGVWSAVATNGYGLLNDFNGGTVRTLADANATLYAYRGASVVRIPASTTRTVVLSRQCSSTITAIIPPGTRVRIKSTGASSVAVQNYNAAALATITTGTFAEFVFDGTNWLLA